jgi:hypothetical protein
MQTLLEQTCAANVSTAVVSQAAKIADLLPTVRPDAVILHVSSASACAFAAIAAMRSHDPHHHLPLLCLLDTTPAADEAPFFDDGVRQLIDADGVPAGRVIESVVTAATANSAR